MAVQTEVGIADYVALVNRYLDRGLTDGLPVIPPSRRQTQEFLMQLTGRTAGELRALGYGDSVPRGLVDGDVVQLLSRPEDAILLAEGGGGPVGGVLTVARFLDVRKLPAD
jgi:hypothetical protein